MHERKPQLYTFLNPIFLNILENSLGLDLKVKYASALDVETGKKQLHYVTRKVSVI